MQLIRSVLFKHPLLGLAIGLAALLLRLAVPAGFMPVLDHGGPALAFCPGAAPAAASAASSAPMASAMSGTSDHGEGGSQSAGGCAFADLALPALGSADPLLLPAALLFILALVLYPAAALAPRAALRLRPPLRGPPLPR